MKLQAFSASVLVATALSGCLGASDRTCDLVPAALVVQSRVVGHPGAAEPSLDAIRVNLYSHSHRFDDRWLAGASSDADGCATLKPPQPGHYSLFASAHQQGCDYFRSEHRVPVDFDGAAKRIHLNLTWEDGCQPIP
jgi:hypothetical protein